jgi:tyrosyl-tRNA synthetase
MDLEEKLELTTRGTIEIIQAAELERLLREKANPRAYWGFECSGMRATPSRSDAHRPRARMR